MIPSILLNIVKGYNLPYFLVLPSIILVSRNFWMFLLNLLPHHFNARRRNESCIPLKKLSVVSSLRYMPIWIQSIGIGLLFFGSSAENLNAINFTITYGKTRRCDFRIRPLSWLPARNWSMNPFRGILSGYMIRETSK